ncbi:Uu.00g064360.m01.CDS01 [Anthostomella pinea]|uniref:Uu.00g064360.m01.CDS01 n=1 Tax=Anthostomella pinea TaxID=933095 RepID=A0AAI8VMZ0_9PEZI|nr:Uu.00g064360.m01.CDS01 [Anthostomella pinea]
MSIQHLPEDVIAQIKSSTTITSLNGVICGLVKNSLDAEATKLTVSVNYARGNCSVEDNGLGIAPAEFKPGGGLGKLHYTSKFPARDGLYGKYGTYIASVASLSLLSLTSHHHNHNSHNSIRIHNSDVLARHTPSPPEHRLLSFPCGTRVTVQDLFGSMPVRVKQRVIDVERGTNLKNWEFLKRAVVALLLAWPGAVSVSIRESGNQWSASLRSAATASHNLGRKDNDITSRVSRLLYQAQFSDDSTSEAWVPLRASVGELSVLGAVSLFPVATRRFQFISIGVQPVPNEHGSNVLYEEINRLFANSSFGFEEESSDLNEDEQKRRAKDRRYKADGFTGQELKGRKCVDRWPMFSIKINLEEQVSRLGPDVDQVLDERQESLKSIVDLLKAVVYEFLKKHHFRPKHFRPNNKSLSSRAESRDSQDQTLSRSTTPKIGRENVLSVGSQKATGRQRTGDLASTRLNIASDRDSRPRPGSPFDLWTRIISGQPQAPLVDIKGSKELEGKRSKGGLDPGISPPVSEARVQPSVAPLFAPDGKLLRAPFADVEVDIIGTVPEEAAAEDIQLQERDELLWTNPNTQETSIINPRTGFVMRPLEKTIGDVGVADRVSHLSSRKKLRTQTKPTSNENRSPWLSELLSSWDNPVFKPPEPQIPTAFDEAKAMGLVLNASRALSHTCNDGFCDATGTLPTVQGRVSKEALHKAEVIAQVDRKFIFAKVTGVASNTTSESRVDPSASLLIIIDQHAADERCRVETLMRDYFAASAVAMAAPHSQSAPSSIVVRSQTELLEKPIKFDISARDTLQFERLMEHFEYWGIYYEVLTLSQGKKASSRQLKWKAFDFFEVSQVKLGDDETRSFFENNEISSVCSGSESLFLGSDSGYVRIIGPSWKVVRSFHAHETGRITHMRQVEGTSLLVTVSEDLSNEPVLKVWALDKPVKKTGLPTCLSTININNGRKQFPISAFTALDDLSQLAVGFANGAVTVIRGDLIHDRGTKQRIVYESEEPITGVEFVADPKLSTLFVATTSKLLKLVISGRGQGQPPRTVEDSGCAAGCMTLNKKTGDIIVVREDAVYYYTLDGRGLCFANDGATKLVSTFQDYVALVSPPVAQKTGASENIRRRFGGASTESIFNAATFTMVDPNLQIVVHSETLISPEKALFQIWGDLFILTQDGKVHRYHEKSLQQRLELLYQRNLFPLAISLAQKAGMDVQQQNVMYRKYGDHLYQKGDYDSAMSQYIKAIDNTEPSQVIREFLDTQRMHNLIEYLEELHEHHKATSDHTTLLLNCYAKLKDVQKLEKFIKSEDDLKFDLDTAITMCRQGGYYDQAAYLATKHGESDLVVDILIEDSMSYPEALDFMWHLEAETAYPCLMKYARVLLEHCPSDTTKLFIDYYTGAYKPKVHLVPVAEAPAPSGIGLAAGAANAVQNLTSLLPLPYMNTSAVPTPPAQDNSQQTVSDSAAIIEHDTDNHPKYTAPPPRSAFSSFIDYPDEFITFLEACLEDTSLKKSDKSDIYTTLFEMYLHKASERKGVNREEWEAKAKKLIDGRDLPIENSNVLLLSHLSNFRDGTTLVKEKSGLLFDIFRSHTSAKDTRGAIKALRKYGPEEPQLYPAALAYFTSDSRILDEAGPEELANVLHKIDADGLMAPLQVIQTLGSNAVATMGMIKPYLHETITRERKEIATNKRQINSFRKETEQKRSEIAELGSKPAVISAQRCPGCGGAIELPAVHFLCKHSFHQRCLKPSGDGDGETECPVCAMNNAAVRAMKRSQDERADRHDLFKDALERGDDRFKTVAQWFGQGVMGVDALE